LEKDGWTTSSNTVTTSTNTANYENLASTNIGMTFRNHKITSGFGHRTQPTAGASTNHQGVDLAYSNNEQIGSFTNGTVIETGYNSGYGNYVLVKDDKGNVHRYAHANSVTVREGDVIKTGQVIAKAGSTGVSTGTHLHYDITNSDGRKINPVNFHHC
jgi:murein DD-endopeptidase MepM/ murein hydrolase activator NlpD